MPNLTDYERVRRFFSWETIRRELIGLSRNKELNIAYEAVNRHAAGPRRNHGTLRWLGKDEARTVGIVYIVADHKLYIGTKSEK